LEAPPDLTDDSDTEMEDVAPVEVKWKHSSRKILIMQCIFVCVRKIVSLPIKMNC
jgi:hypothetical protein